MDGLLLFLGHLIGDYVVQNDWMAANKTAAHPGPEPHRNRIWLRCGVDFKGDARIQEEDPPDLAERRAWLGRRDAWLLGHLACTAHCVCYTLAVWLCSFWWMPWWGLVACFAAHWPIDRFRLARLWMTRASGQAAFATGPLAPWSVIIVDNVFHVATLAVIGKVAA